MAGYSKAAISKIADYASDPVGYCKRKGGVRNRKAAETGSRGHVRVAGTLSTLRIGVVFLLLLGLYFYLANG